MGCVRLAPLLVCALVACGDHHGYRGDAGVTLDGETGGAIDGAIDARPDAPGDAGIDATPRCGDDHVDPGEQCDGVEHLEGDGCSASCTPEGVTWTNLTPNPAPPRAGAAIAYDAARHRLVLFGGFPSFASVSDETWELDGTTWTKRLALVKPPPRYGHAMVYDSARQRIVMFGGTDFSSNELGDTWEWDGSTWMQRTSTVSPPAQYLHEMVYDPVRQVTVLWGRELDKVWEWDGTAWSVKTATIDQCCGGGTVSMTYAGSNGVMIVGANAVWFWDGASWTRHAFTAQVPWGASTQVVAVFDAANARPVAFANTGTYPEGIAVWEWINDNWVKRAPIPAGAPQHDVTYAAYDPDRAVTVLYGGLLGELGIRDVWEWNGTTWRHRYGSIPEPRWFSATTYDARRGRIVMFGGWGAERKLDDTWEWDGSWHARSPSASPPARQKPAVAYDEHRGRVVMHGGTGLVQDQNGQWQGVQFEDTWLWDGTNWTEAVATSHPGPATSNAMTFDRRHDYVLLCTNNETWTWDGATWTKRMPAHQPVIGYLGSLSYDAHRGVAVLLSPATDSMGNSIFEIWEWTGSDWVSKGQPPAGGHLFYDPLRARVVLHDGAVPETSWTWDGTAWSAPLTTNDPLEYGAVFDPTTASWFSFGTITGWDTWLATSVIGPREQCDGTDADGDGLLRCADPDCWWRCTPLCAPGEVACDPTAPRCGDGTCSSLESPALCPADCP